MRLYTSFSDSACLLCKSPSQSKPPPSLESYIYRGGRYNIEVNYMHDIIEEHDDMRSTKYNPITEIIDDAMRNQCSCKPCKRLRAVYLKKMQYELDDRRIEIERAKRMQSLEKHDESSSSLSQGPTTDEQKALEDQWRIIQAKLKAPAKDELKVIKEDDNV